MVENLETIEQAHSHRQWKRSLAVHQGNAFTRRLPETKPGPRRLKFKTSHHQHNSIHTAKLLRSPRSNMAVIKGTNGAINCVEEDIHSLLTPI